MSTMPIDLQVLFTKSFEQGENVARQSNLTQSGYIAGYEKIHHESQETNEKVNNLEQYAEDFTKVGKDSKQNRQGQKEKEKKAKELENPVAEYKRAPTEEGTGKIIDIVD